MIDRFSKQEFEDALPKHKRTGEPLWQELGVFNGEYRYIIPIEARPGLSIHINSSIGLSGRAFESGKNSIRIWVTNEDGQPMFKKEDAWTTRTTGWQSRMMEKLRSQYAKAMKCRRCPDCGAWMVVRNGKHGPFLGCGNYPNCKHTEPVPEEAAKPVQLRMTQC